MKRIRELFPSKYFYLKYFLLTAIVLFLSCTKKDTRICYTCTITYITSTSVPVDGFPQISTMDVEICEVTIEEVHEFEEKTKGSESVILEDVTYTTSYSTKCQVK
jgi:hypothetical protein